MSADMDEIYKICSNNNMILIEDTCESMGAKWNGRKVGTFENVLHLVHTIHITSALLKEA